MSTDTDLTARIAEALRLDAEATRGPWLAEVDHFGDDHGWVATVADEAVKTLFICETNAAQAEAHRSQAMNNARFIAAARTLLPALARDAEALRGERDRLHKVLCELLHGEDGEWEELVDAPDHSHRVPGAWDGTNKPCEWCAAWNRARAALTSPAPDCSIEDEAHRTCSHTDERWPLHEDAASGEFTDAEIDECAQYANEVLRCKPNKHDRRGVRGAIADDNTASPWCVLVRVKAAEIRGRKAPVQLTREQAIEACARAGCAAVGLEPDRALDSYFVRRILAGGGRGWVGQDARFRDGALAEARKHHVLADEPAMKGAK